MRERVEPDEAQPSLPPIQPDFKIPERRRGASRPVPDLTPLDDLRTAWGPAVEAVEADFKNTKHCNGYGPHEKILYGPLMNAKNAALNVLSRSMLDSSSPKIAQYYRANDPKKHQGGMFNKFHIPPDLVVIHKGCRPSKEEDLRWSNPLYILEVKPYDSPLRRNEYA